MDGLICNCSGNIRYGPLTCGNIRGSYTALKLWLVGPLVPFIAALLIGSMFDTSHALTLITAQSKHDISQARGMFDDEEDDWYGLGTFGGCRRKGVERGEEKGEAVCAGYGEYGSGAFANPRPFEEYAISRGPIIGGILGIILVLIIAHFTLLMLRALASNPYVALIKGKKRAHPTKSDTTAYPAHKQGSHTQSLLLKTLEAAGEPCADIKRVQEAQWKTAIRFTARRFTQRRGWTKNWLFIGGELVIGVLAVAAVTLCVMVPKDKTGELGVRAGLGVYFILGSTAPLYFSIFACNLYKRIKHRKGGGQLDKELYELNAQGQGVNEGGPTMRGHR